MRRRVALLVLGALALTACAGGGSVLPGTGEAATADDASMNPPVATDDGPIVPCVRSAREPGPPAAPQADDGTPFPWDDAGAAVLRGFDTSEVLRGGPSPDGIRPIDDPCVHGVDGGDQWLDDEESVLLLEVDGEARAYPLAIMTQHEIVNDVLAGVPVTVTYCPLCNSGLAFVRVRDGEVWSFGTSGRLLRSNLVMYDRQTRTLWSQFTGEALWGDAEVVGDRLERIPTQTLGWATVRELHPDATVLSRESMEGRSYGRNPYPGYEGRGSGYLYEGPLDEARLDPDARVVGIGEEGDAVAIPLARLRDERVVTVELDDGPVTVVWAPGQASALDSAAVAEGVEVGQTGAFAVAALEEVDDGVFRDPATGTTHDLTGRTVDGDAPDLAPVALDDTFWFVWFAFRPGTELAVD